MDKLINFDKEVKRIIDEDTSYYGVVITFNDKWESFYSKQDKVYSTLYELESRGYKCSDGTLLSDMIENELEKNNKVVWYLLVDVEKSYVYYETEICPKSNFENDFLVYDYKDIEFDFIDDKEYKWTNAEKLYENKNGHTIYISGAITGTTDYMERFENAENKLKELGYDVINPAKINSFLPTDTTWKQYMEVDYKLLDVCDSIYMLSGWENSKGANAELEYANLKGGYCVFYEEDDDNDEMELLTANHTFDFGYCDFKYSKQSKTMYITTYDEDGEIVNTEYLNENEITKLLNSLKKVLKENDC